MIKEMGKNNDKGDGYIHNEEDSASLNFRLF